MSDGASNNPASPPEVNRASSASDQVRKPLLLRGVLICLLAAVFYTYEYLLRIEPNVMVWPLRMHFHLNAVGFGMLFASYFYAYTPLQLVVGFILDRFGCRWVMSSAVALCAFGALLFSVSDQLSMAVVARWMIGAGSAFAFIGVLKLGVGWLPQRFFGVFVGFATALGMLGGLFGEVILGHLEAISDWSSVIRYSAYAGFVLLPLFILFVREPRAKELKGAPSVVQDDAAQPADLRHLLRAVWFILRQPSMWCLGFSACMLFSSLTVFASVSGVPMLQAKYHQSLAWATHLVTAVFAGWLVGAPLLGWVADYFSLRRAMLVGGSLAVCAVWAVFLYAPLHAAWMIWSVLFVYGLASSSEVVAFAMMRDWAPENISATALALVNFFVMLGGMVLQPLISTVLQWAWSGHMRGGIQVYAWHDYRWAMSVLLMLLFAGFITAIFAKKPLAKRGWTL